MNEMKSKLKKSPWDGSENEWLRVLPPKKKGSFGEKIVAEVYKKLGADVKKSKGTDSDIIVNGKKIEIKLSCCAFKGDNPCSFTFFQIRQFQDYDYIAFFSVYPDHAEIHVIDKKDFMNYICKNEKEVAIAGGKEKYNRLCKKYGKDWLLNNDLFHWVKDAKSEWPVGTVKVL
jgi:hypothetical protein